LSTVRKVLAGKGSHALTGQVAKRRVDAAGDAPPAPAGHPREAAAGWRRRAVPSHRRRRGEAPPRPERDTRPAGKRKPTRSTLKTARCASASRWPKVSSSPAREDGRALKCAKWLRGINRRWPGRIGAWSRKATRRWLS